MLIKYEHFFKYISNHTGLEIKHLSDVENIFNSLTIQVNIFDSDHFIYLYIIIYILFPNIRPTKVVNKNRKIGKKLVYIYLNM